MEAQPEFLHQTHTFIEFKRRAAGLVARVPRTNWGWLYVAQHHGLPTRLLDWTESAHAALCFALRQRVREDACVWMLSPGRMNKLAWNIKEVVVTVDADERARVLLNPYLQASASDASPGKTAALAVIPEYVSPRLQAQRGVFVAFGEDESALSG